MNKTRNSYFTNDGRITSSFLKAVRKGPHAIKSYINDGELNFNLKSNESMLIGTVVDCLQTQPDKFNDQFILEETKPSDTIVKIITDIYKDAIHINSLDELHDDIIRQFCIQNNYYVDNKYYNTSIKNVREASYFFDFLKKSGGKICLTKEDFDIATKQVDKLTNHVYTKDFFNIEYPDVRVVYQKRFNWEWEWEFENIQCKSLIDMLIINESSDETYRLYNYVLPPKSILIIDLKYTSKPIEFFSNDAIKYDYPFQLYFYKQAVEYSISKAPEYRVLNPIFLVVSKISNYPLVYEMSDNDLDICKYGGVYHDGILEPNLDRDLITSDKLSLKETIELYLEYRKIGDYSIHPEHYKNKGIVKNIFKQ